MQFVFAIRGLALLTGVSGCVRRQPGPAVVDTSVDLGYHRGERNLFSPFTAVFNASNVAVFYVVGGKAQPVNHPDRDTAGGSRCKKTQQPGANIMRVVCNDQSSSGITKTIVHIGSGISDTVKCQVEKFNERSLAETRVWCNGRSVSDQFDTVGNIFGARKLIKLER